MKPIRENDKKALAKGVATLINDIELVVKHELIRKSLKYFSSIFYDRQSLPTRRCYILHVNGERREK